MKSIYKLLEFPVFFYDRDNTCTIPNANFVIRSKIGFGIMESIPGINIIKGIREACRDNR